MNFKTFFSLLFSIIFFLFACTKYKKETTACLPSNLQTGLIAFYPFSNGSLNDNVNGNNLVNNTTATPSMDRSGNPNCAFQFKNFPSGNEFLTHRNPIFLNNLTEFSISLWYEPLDTNRWGGVYEGLISRDTSAQSGDRYGQWSVGLYDCRRAVFGLNCGTLWDNLQNLKDCETPFYTNKWHHLVVIYSNNKLTLFRNGVMSTEPSFVNAQPCISASQDIGDLFIGKSFTGRIDDIAIFNRVITTAEVNQLLKLQACCE
jgi:Concanavalin A-like lectin/glucanases superfamily